MGTSLVNCEKWSKGFRILSHSYSGDELIVLVEVSVVRHVVVV